MGKTILTKWEMRTYDVWGNAKDGYEVNNSFSSGEHELRLKVHTHNQGTEFEFQSAHPSDYQLQKLFGIRCKLDTDGDDLNVYINRASDGYPIGELYCVSHSSLSPIRELDKPVSA